LVIAVRSTDLTESGASVPRLSSSAWVAEWPVSPIADTSTSSAGKMDSTA
jgi:hypothetical protein